MIDMLPPEKVAAAAFDFASKCEKAPLNNCPALSSVKSVKENIHQPEIFPFINALNRLLSCPHASAGRCTADSYMQNLFNRFNRPT
ncbi:MAG: hypothetical protein OQJ97_13390 [Rhodospirillales bacterium]|nr:hypothetical protein [Rhodospirillales bacterium]